MKVRLHPSVFLASWLLLLAVAPPVSAQTATEEAPAATNVDLPDGRAVIAKYIEAIGGKEKVMNSPSVAKGKFKMPAANVEAEMIIKQDGKSRLYFEAEFPGLGNMVRATNGTIGWETSAMTGPRLIEGEELAQVLREADSASDIDLDKYFVSVECVDKVEMDGQPCYEVKLTDKNEKVETRYYSVDSGLLVAQKQIQASVMGEIETESHVSDYREIGGLKLPFKVVVDVAGTQQEIVLESVEIGEVPEEVFEVPEEIKELLPEN